MYEAKNKLKKESELIKMTQPHIKLTNKRYRLKNHISAASGWINDPNGFCYFKGYYHIFFQHHPQSAEWGPMHWGHFRSKDLVNWEELPIALTPGDVEDKDGCFSGSAIVKDDVLYLFYTGHHYYGDGNPDNFWQNQNMAYSKDGINFTKYENNPIIAKEPEDNTHHFRDPKVWEHAGLYYMLLGSQEEDGLGRGIIYTSKDLLNWDYQGAMSKSNGVETEGFMWECPDFFSISGKEVLLLSPQGMVESGKDYLNLFETGYFVGNYDYTTNKFNRGNFKELDKGHDFYATQTTQAPDGRRLVFAWMAMWESPMPEQIDGWAGALTLPRELVLEDEHLYMRPVKELEQLRVGEGVNLDLQLKSELLLEKNVSPHELEVSFNLKGHQDNIIQFVMKNDKEDNIISLTYNHLLQEFTLQRGDSADLRYAKIKSRDLLSLRIFIDTSSVEIFINNGETAFTERYYSESKPSLYLSASQETEIKGASYPLDTNVIHYK